MSNVPNSAIAATIRADIMAANESIARARNRVQDCLTLALRVEATDPGIAAGLRRLADVETERAAYFEGRLPVLQIELERWTQ